MLPSSDVDKYPNVGEILFEGEFGEIGARANAPCCFTSTMSLSVGLSTGGTSTATCALTSTHPAA